mgnify:FL=1
MPEKVCILQTTDVHCQMDTHDELFWEDGQAVFRQCGGYAQLSARLKALKREYPQSLLLDTGDMFQGSMLSVLTEGEALVPILNALPYDLYVPGNWEVIYGKEQMIRLLGALKAPTICANMHHDERGLPGALIFKPYFIWKAAGLRIAILGYTDPLVPLRQSPSYSRGIVYSEPAATLPHYVKELRAMGADMILIACHLGLSQEIALANNPAARGVDYILGGDTHERVRKPIRGKFSTVVEPGAFGSFIGKLILSVAEGRIKRKTYSLLEVDAAKVPPDQKVQSLIEREKAPYLSEMQAVVGHSRIPLYRYFVIENPIDTLVTDALAWRFPEIDIAFSNGFRFCPPLATIGADGRIAITRAYIYDMLPVDSVVRTGKVSGLQLRNWLEKELNNVFAREASKRFGGWLVKFKGMQVEFEAYAEMGQRVKRVRVGAKALKDAKVYSILACEREGDPDDHLCRLQKVQDAKNTRLTLHDVLLEYLAAHPTVNPKPRGDAVALDAPATLLSQVSGVDYEFR